jgi:enolase-phosphatase E1
VFRTFLYFTPRRDQLNGGEPTLPQPFVSGEIRAILLDIEGTTTPIDFVFKTLFPFASTHVEDFLRRHFREADVAALLRELHIAREKEAVANAPEWVRPTDEENRSGAAEYIRWLIARDSKITPLKTLQGKIWEEGFRSNKLKGEVYPDVAPALARWNAQGRRIAIFSSGSVLAQRLLFANSTAGDLSSFLEGYFDTTTGPKREMQSYRKIADVMGLHPRELWFVSDVVEELDAALAAGMKTALSLRLGVTRPQIAVHPEIHDFSELFPNS